MPRTPRRFICRTRYFTDSGIIGTKEFVAATYQRFKAIYPGVREKRPKAIAGLEGVYFFLFFFFSRWVGF
jgi:hypothetical protein